MLELGAPLWLWLLPLPFVALLVRARRRARDPGGEVLMHPMAGLIGDIQGSRRRVAGPWLWLLGCVLLVLALARPQWLDEDAFIHAPVHDVVFAVDVSGSMRAMDYVVDGRPASRLDMLKRSLREFFERASGLRVGLLVFADDALTLMPLTADLALAAGMTDDIDNSLAGERTAIGDAVALAARRVADSPGEARVLVLLTDGGDTASTVPPEAAAARARELGMRIYTVGFGRDEAAPFPIGAGGEVVYAEHPLDEASLQGLAEAGEGTYFRVRETADLGRVLDHIEALEKARVPMPVDRREWHWLPTILGLLLLLLAEYRRQREAVPA